MVEIGVVSLGCDKNRVDTEVMLSNLTRHGYAITNDEKNADVLIVNTCAFIEPARKESVDTILQLSNMKTQGKCKKLIITGCLPQKFAHEIYEDFVEVDGFVGTNDYYRIGEIVDRVLNGERVNITTDNSITIPNDESRIITTQLPTAYLKIADGCDNFCTYCLIPSIRGKFRSRDIDSLFSEAVNLVKQGVKEIILVAQDVTMYGKDIYNKLMIVPLIQKLSSIDDLKWIRLLYCYPELMSEELISEVSTNDKVVKYLDIPLQHVSDSVLRLMGRKSSNQAIRSLFTKLFESINGLAIRTTFMLGFPNETDKDIECLTDFVNDFNLTNVGFFTYSQEEGTPAAKLKGQIEQSVKNERLEQLAKIQFEKVKTINSMLIGCELECIIEEFVEKDEQYFYYKGRTSNQAPSIDGCIYLSSVCKNEIGSFVVAKVIDFDEYDLMGEIL